ncbi:zinc metalloprotease [Candidatus Endoriftia persephone str. Guaymas]|nr:zinc metalloprotease [Candidatus Endoriftia persephone str. Guaymas]
MDLEYTIVRSNKRRKLTITVERDRSVVVHAPVGVPEAKIQQVVESKRQWLFEKRRHSQKYDDLPHPPGKELVNGESAMYLGRNYRIAITDTASGKIEFARQFLIPPNLAERGPKALASWYFTRAEQKILPRVEHYARKLGVEYGSAKVSDSKFRWGSCTVNNNLSFNWRLIKAPMSVIDYVVVHELAHLIEANHTPRFWNIVKAQVPATEKAKAWLKEHGALLEQNL